jgi:hypothetical protein
MGISGLQLCELLETDYACFDGRRRRARAIAGADAAAQPDHAGAIVIPVKSLKGWHRYDLEDAVLFGIALAAEQAGLVPEDAARLVVASDAKRVLAHPAGATDFFIGRVVIGGRTIHAGDTWAKWQAFLADEATPPDSLVVVNASHVLRIVKTRAGELGLAQHLGVAAA